NTTANPENSTVNQENTTTNQATVNANQGNINPNPNDVGIGNAGLRINARMLERSVNDLLTSLNAHINPNNANRPNEPIEVNRVRVYTPGNFMRMCFRLARNPMNNAPEENIRLTNTETPNMEDVSNTAEVNTSESISDNNSSNVINDSELNSSSHVCAGTENTLETSDTVNNSSVNNLNLPNSSSETLLSDLSNSNQSVLNFEDKFEDTCKVNAELDTASAVAKNSFSESTSSSRNQSAVTLENLKTALSSCEIVSESSSIDSKSLSQTDSI
ncbi:hypothetical protein LOTGIDRAFT_176598, partial [Lottia gigantea]